MEKAEKGSAAGSAEKTVMQYIWLFLYRVCYHSLITGSFRPRAHSLITYFLAF